MANSSPVVVASDQSAVPVSGTVTANIGTVATLATAAKQDTGNTSLATVAGAVSGTEMQVDVLTMPTTTVQATNLDIRDLSSASDSVTAVQATAANLNMTEANSAAIKTAVETIDNAISGNEMQVDVITMPTVTVTATNLDVQSGGADLATSTQAGAIQTAVELIDDTVKVLGTDTYTEAASKGLVIGAVRRDADTTLVNTTNEIGPLQMDASGRLKVEAFSGETLPVSLTSTTITGTVAVTQSGTWDEVGINDSGNSITVDNGGTFVTQENGAALTALQLLDDTIIADNAGFTDGTTKVNMSGYIYDEVAGTALTENDAAAARINANRAQVHAIEDGTTRGRYATVTASNALKVDNSGVPQPVSAASLPLPTGASTLAEQQTQTTALQLIDDIVYTDDTSTHSTGTSKGALFMAAATPTDTAVNANDIGALGMTNNRELYVSLRDISGAAAVTGSGTATGALRVELPTNGTGTVGLNAGTNAIGKLAANSGVDIGDVDVTSVIAGTGATNLGKAEDAAHTTGDTGVAVLQRRIDTAATSADTSGDYATANQSAEGASWATLTPTTTSGLSVANFTSGDTYTALTNSAQVIKASAGNLYGYYIYNPNATAAYVMVYNTAAASVTVGTTTATLVFAIPATAAANLMFPYPITFSNAGWSCAAATTGGGNAAPSTALEVMFWYK